MSTLRLSVGLLILMLLLGLVGCTSTSATRVAPTPKMRTVASVGDTPLATVTGEPGDSVVAATDPSERPSRVDPEGRVSGRVVDEQNQPVANARVRLAVSSAPGGPVIRASTDPSGGFTLRGLRPGTPYTVIAEWEDAQGVLTGRSIVEAPNTSVRIALAPADTESHDPTTSTRVNPVSRRDPAEEDVAEVVGSPINIEDLPPAPEAELLSPATRRKVRVASDPGESFTNATPRAGGWRRREPCGPAAGDSDVFPNPTPNPNPNPNQDTEPSLSPRRGANFPGDTTTPDDDGPNPLPPALEPGQASLSLPALGRGKNPRDDARATPVERTTTLTRFDEEPAPFPEVTPGALVALPRSTTSPVAASEVPAPVPLPPPTELPPVAEQAPGSAGSGSVASNDGLLPPPVESGESAAAAASPLLLPTPVQSDPPVAASRPRPRWRDLAASEANPPPLETAEGQPVASGGSEPNTTRVVRGSPKEPDLFCRFDPKHRRIDDFRLPDLQGRLVRFQDFDADLILLDFWGTWCQPCVRSVPHLVDLQKRLGGKQLQIVGIACEREETPPAQRVAGVSKAAKKLGINYPVLVSSMDGTCPLQKALHVQAYPTMILVDRQGRILWQDQGATRVTMARLDRMLDMATRSDAPRRY